MKLLLVTTVFPSPLQPQRGAFNFEMVRAFGPAHEVRVIAPVAWPGALRARWQRLRWDSARRVDGIDVRHPVYFYTPRALRTHYGAFFRWSIRAAVDDILQGCAPDVVVGYWAHPDGHAALTVARRLGVPGIVMVGGSDILLLGRDAGRGSVIRQVLEDADAIVTVSDDLKRALNRWAIPPAKVHVVYRGVDLARFAPGSQAEARRRLGIDRTGAVLLYVGHLVAVKGLDVLLAACARAAERADFHLYLVGDGPMKAALQRACTELRIADRVTFVGAVSHAALPDWYRAADRTVLSSRSEGVPNVLLESAASGTPFIAPRIGGIPEIADPPADRLVPPGDPVALADAIVGSLSTPGSVHRQFKPISLQESARQLIDVLSSTTTQARRARMTAASVRAAQSEGASS
ncbi:MAG TPA: glycosyltransferase [Vicinamibacterales bacterium]|nr:glycosyltransferase [Vicinamibacterales bacterium]